MATRGIAHTIQFVAWDTSANSGKTGDGANFTMRWVKDGTSSALTTTTVTEIDSTNCPGLYKVGISATEADCNIGTLAGKSSTASISIIPITIQFERLPDAAPAAAGGVNDTLRINNVSTSSVTTISANVGTTQPLNFTGTGASATVKGDLVNIAGAAVSPSTAQLGVNVVNFGGSAGTFASGRPEVNTTHAAGTAWGSGAITSGAFAAGAITASAIAADAIGASELAADAVTEIAAAVWNSAMASYQTAGTMGLAMNELDTIYANAYDGVNARMLANTTHISGSTPASQIQSAVGLASANLDTQLSTIAGYIDTEVAAIKAKTDNLPSSFPTNFSSLSITSAGLVATTSNVKKNQALSSFMFLMTDSTNHAPAAGLTVTVTRSIDGGAFAAGTLSSVTEVSAGMYKVDFAAADLNGNVIVLKATATGADTTLERIVTQP